MARRMLFCLIAVMALGVTAGADEDHSAARIPTGDAWWCFDASVFRDGETAQLGGCYRSRHGCVDSAAQNQDAAVQAHDRFANNGFECARYKKAVGFTFRDAVQGELRHLQFLHPQECERIRRTHLTIDYKDVSRCDVIGNVQASPFEAALVPKGSGWYCMQSDGGLSTCRRTKTDCAEAVQHLKGLGIKNVTNCAAQSHAYGVTSRGEVMIAASQEACEDFAEELPEASRCTKVQ